MRSGRCGGGAVGEAQERPFQVIALAALRRLLFSLLVVGVVLTCARALEAEDTPPMAQASVPTPKLVLSRARLKFSKVQVLTKPSLTLNIKNGGTATLSGSVGDLLSPLQVASSAGAFSLTPGGIQQVTVRYMPVSLTPQSQKLVISSNDPSHSTVNVPVTATATTGGKVVITQSATSTPLPLSPLQLTVLGLGRRPAPTVKFFNGAGLSVTGGPIRIQRGGTMIVGTPLYVDPASGAIGPGAASLVVNQGRRTSNALALNIQDMPPLSTYGLQLGQISHSFLVFEATLIANRLGELQAVEPLLNGTPDTILAQFTLTNLMQAAIFARNDVDRVLLNNTTVVPWGTLPDTTAIQFDATQLDTMDRLIALYLFQQFGSLISPGLSRALATSHWRAADLQSELNTVVNGTVSMMAKRDGVVALVGYFQGTANSTDAQLGVLEGLETVFKGAGVDQLGAGVGAIGALGHFADSFSAMLGDLTPIADCLGSTTCTQQQADAYAQQMQSNAEKAVSADISLIAKIPDLAGLEAGLGSVLGEGLSSLLTIAAGAGAGELQSAEATDAAVANTPLFAQHFSANQGLAQVTGTATISNTQGVAASQSSLDLCCFGAAQLGISGLADPSGDYSLFVPLAAPNTNYSNLTLSVGDPVTGTVLNSEVVDLTALAPGTPIQAPTLTGSCSDSDALTPDADDPDCD